MNPELHTLTGAYALDALSEAERAAFIDHLAQCAACRKEVAELQETAAQLGEAMAAPAPTALKPAVMAQIRRTRQLPPDEGPIIPLRGRRWPLRVANAVAAAAAAVAVALGVVVVQQGDEASRAQRQLDELSTDYRELVEVLGAPDARVVRSGEGRLTASVVVSDDQDALAFVPQRLPAPDPGKVYQLWLIGPDGAQSAGLLAQPPRPVVQDAVSGAEQLGVTVEPAGGSSQPTSDPVLLLSFRA